MLVDLVEVVLQDLHLVLSGAARGLGRHGPGTAAGEGEAAVMSEAVGRAEERRSGAPQPAGLSPPAQARRGCPALQAVPGVTCAGPFRGARLGDPPVDLR